MIKFINFLFFLLILNACDSKSCDTSGSSNQNNNSNNDVQVPADPDALAKADAKAQANALVADNTIVVDAEKVENTITDAVKKQEITKSIKEINTLKDEINTAISNANTDVAALEDLSSKLKSKTESLIILKNTAAAGLITPEQTQAKQSAQIVADSAEEELNKAKDILNNGTLSDSKDLDNKQQVLGQALMNFKNLSATASVDDIKAAQKNIVDALNQAKAAFETAEVAAKQKAEQEERVAKEEQAKKDAEVKRLAEAKAKEEQERLAKENAKKNLLNAKIDTVFTRADIMDKAFDKSGKEINIEKEANDKQKFIVEKLRENFDFPKDINGFKKIIENNGDLDEFLYNIDFATVEEKGFFLAALNQTDDTKILAYAFQSIKQKFNKRFKLNSHYIYKNLGDDIKNLPASNNYGLVRIKIAEIAEENHIKTNEVLVQYLNEILKNKHFNGMDMAINIDKNIFSILDSHDKRKELYKVIDNLYANIKEKHHIDYIENIILESIDYLSDKQRKFTIEDEKLINNLVKNKDIAKKINDAKYTHNLLDGKIKKYKEEITNNNSQELNEQYKTAIQNIETLKQAFKDKADNDKEIVSILKAL